MRGPSGVRSEGSAAAVDTLRGLRPYCCALGGRWALSLALL